MPVPALSTPPCTHLLYLHGFRSSPQSMKAIKVAARMAQQHPGVVWWCPQLPPSPREAMALVMRGISGWPQAQMAVIGSSLGGFYATAVAQHTGCRAALLNPAVYPARDLAAHIGEQTSWQNPQERFFFRAEYVDELRALDPGPITLPERYFAVIAKGDEVLDWREMTARYPGACIKLLEGGDHALSDFDEHLEEVLGFLGWRPEPPGAPQAAPHPHATIPRMFALFEDAGKFLAGRVLSEAEASAQVELDSGKRVKVKSAHILLKFDKPAPAELLAQAQAISQTIELELAWEFAPEDEFGFAELARVYFDDKASLAQQAGALLRLFEAPHYFRRAGKGRFKKAPAEIIQQALAAIEKKKAQQEQIAAWATELAAGHCPQPIRDQLYKILFKPDKNGPEYKAVVEASRASQTAPLDLLQRSGAIDSPYQFHWKRFLFDNFPKGTAFPALVAPEIKDELPVAAVQAFSIDDSQTTEIDDALSLQGLGTGTVVLGIHIAAPALALQAGDAIDAVARQRLSTVYMPGYKITMLPDEVVQRYTLQAGRDCPAVSLYVTLDEATLEIKGSQTRLERVPIAANLRHDQLDALVTAPWLEEPSYEPAAPASAPDSLVQGQNSLSSMPGARGQLSFLYRLAKHLKAGRELVRGKPETFNRPDYNFRLVGNNGAEPQGTESVQISTRQRGAPLDLIVAEAMILANSSWGNWLAEHGVPGIYRSQASLAPGVKVRMGTKAQPHAGIGVKSYAWSTSPLRRYTDLVNQWQIIAVARHGKTAALAAPFKPKDAELFSIISSFDAAYTAYNGYQAGMERFWTLKYLQQQGLGELKATAFKEGLVRADDLPLVLPVLGAGDLPRGAQVLVRLGAIDLISLDVTGTVLERLDTFENARADAQAADGPGDDQDDEPVAGPIAIAVDLHDAAPTDTGSADNPAP